MNQEKQSIDAVIDAQLNPPPAEPSAASRFTRTVMVQVDRRRRRQRTALVLVPMACALAFWFSSRPESPPAQSLVNPMATMVQTVPSSEGMNQDALDRLWAAPGEDIDGSSDAEPNEQEILAAYGEDAWMPSHHLALSQILGLSNDEESL